MAGPGGPGWAPPGGAGGEGPAAPPPPALSHLAADGSARMVDIGDKPETERRATAYARVELRPATLAQICARGTPKGDLFAVARLAGILGAKRTPDLIPLCHPLPLSCVEVAIEPEGEAALAIRCTCATRARTGVEMEAMTGAALAALAVYDMVKGLDRAAAIAEVRLLEKSGGRSGPWRRGES
ncbi:MAG: cyclic pyranopterin monophosphate synthase accessory protein 3 [Planctomycetota bacterium]|nr:MAG: cyclic pyranopterin monophosphate synthase accessory protein 3 [Planctomycetota bacterium]